MSVARCSASSSGSRSRLLSTSQRGLAASVLAELLQLRDDGARVAHRIGIRVARRDIDQVQQHAGALQVLQEPDAEARPFGRALDQARNIGHDEAAVLAAVHHAEIRMQRRERIVGDLRPRSRDRADQGRFAGVRQPQQPHVGDHLELERQRTLFARAVRARTAAARDWCWILKRVLPQPPLPPCATFSSCPQPSDRRAPRRYRDR